MFPLLFAALMAIAFATLIASMTTLSDWGWALDQSTMVQFGSEQIGSDSTDGTENAIPSPPAGKAVWGVEILVSTAYTATGAQAVIAGAAQLDSAISKIELKFGGETFQITNSVTYRWLQILQQAFTKTAITAAAPALFAGAATQTYATHLIVPCHSRSAGAIKVTEGAVTAVYAANVTQVSTYTYSVIFGEDNGRPEWGIDVVTLPSINGPGTVHDKLKACVTDMMAFAGLTEAQFTSLLASDASKVVFINELGGELLDKATQCGKGLARVANSLTMPCPGGAQINSNAYILLTTSAANVVSVAYTRLLGSSTPGAATSSSKPPVSITPTPAQSIAGRPKSRMDF